MSITRWLARLVRVTRDAEAWSSLDPGRIFRRTVNKAVMRYVARGLLWRPARKRRWP